MALMRSPALLLLCIGLTAAEQPPPADPSPPAVHPLAAELSVPAPQANELVQLRRPPNRLVEGAIVSDWPALLGPEQRLVNRERPLRADWLADDTAQPIWDMPIGVGFSAPVVVGDRLLLYRRVGDEAVLDCLRSSDGARFWRSAHPTNYVDRFRYNGGPRATPVVAAGRVVTYSPLGRLRCTDLATGHLFWERDLGSEFAIPPAYFGLTTSPVVADGIIYVNVGGRQGPEMIACGLDDGRLRWVSGSAWGASYATPLAVELHGRDVLVAFLGGAITSDKPPFPGGLLILDRADGTELFRHPWRSKQPASVNASSPVIHGDQILVSSLYGPGALAISLDAQMRARVLYRTRKFASHWMTPIVKDDILYGFAGDALVALRWQDGQQLWQTKPTIPPAIIAGDETAAGGKAQPLGNASLLSTEYGFLCLGSTGLIAWLELDAQGWQATSAARLFQAKGTFTAPVLSHGLLFVVQNVTGNQPDARARLFVYDLRATEPLDPPPPPTR